MSETSRPVELPISGMDCTSCALGIERQLRKLGVIDPVVNYANASAHFELPPGVSLPSVVQAIERLGYSVTLPNAPPALSKPNFSLKSKFWICLVFTLPLILHHLLGEFSILHLLHDPYIQLALGLPPFAIGLIHFGSSGWRSLRAGQANMDVLIAIGISAAFGYSLYGTLMNLGPEFMFYESAATITTIVLLGNLIEAWSVKKTTSAIGELSRVQATRATRIDKSAVGEILTEIDATQIQRGDRLLVVTGKKIPADGVIYWGDAAIDESMISGESMPVERISGQSVIGGTVVERGSFKMTATNIGEDTVLAGIIRLVKEAQSSKPSIQRLGDQVSAIFIPIVLGISLATLLVSYLLLETTFQAALLRAIAVLVISCPCAMGLATPTAVMVGIGRAARMGILIRGGSTLEVLAGVRQVVFDKTGTLTTGQFTVDSFETFGLNQEEAKSLIVALEHHSAHPLAQSLVRAFRGVEPATLDSFEELRGIGVQARTSSGQKVEFGASLNGDPIPGNLHLRLDGRVIAALTLSDEIKPSAASTVTQLKQLGLEPILLSGDRREKCEQVGHQLGIESILSEQSPAQKLSVIEKLERAQPTAFVGDGINDAPSLARASVGVSLSDATHAAIQSAQVVLLSGQLDQAVTAYQLSRETLLTIKQNLFWAFSYNIVAIPIAAAGFLNPMLAALAMGFSDFMTIGNSLRLRNKPLSLTKRVPSFSLFH